MYALTKIRGIGRRLASLLSTINLNSWSVSC
jgi:ribosomal protein S13